MFSCSCFCCIISLQQNSTTMPSILEEKDWEWGNRISKVWQPPSLIFEIFCYSSSLMSDLWRFGNTFHKKALALHSICNVFFTLYRRLAVDLRRRAWWSKRASDAHPMPAHTTRAVSRTDRECFHRPAHRRQISLRLWAQNCVDASQTTSPFQIWSSNSLDSVLPWEIFSEALRKI